MDTGEKGFLGDAAVRLGRMLGLKGQTSPTFKYGDKLQPVLVVSDGTVPGMGQQRGRRLGWHVDQATTTAVHIRAEVDLVIDWLEINFRVFALAAQLDIGYKGPGDAMGAEVLGGLPSGMTLDRALTLQELAPISYFIGGAVGTRFYRKNLLVASDSIYYVGPFFLASGARITILPPGAGNTFGISLFGRLF